VFSAEGKKESQRLAAKRFKRKNHFASTRLDKRKINESGKKKKKGQLHSFPTRSKRKKMALALSSTSIQEREKTEPPVKKKF